MASVLSMSEINSGYKGSEKAWIQLWRYVVEQRSDFVAGVDQWYIEPINLFLDSITEGLKNLGCPEELKGELSQKMPKSYRDFVNSGCVKIFEQALDCQVEESDVNKFFIADNVVKINSHSLKRLIDIESYYLLRDVSRGKKIEQWEEDGDRTYDVQKYYIYGKNQEMQTWSFSFLPNWVNVIANSYLVAELRLGNGEVIFLSPDQVTNDGEWEAYHYTCDDHDVTRYRSFAELIMFKCFNILFNFNRLEIGENKIFDEMLSILFDLDILKLHP